MWALVVDVGLLKNGKEIGPEMKFEKQAGPKLV